MVHRLFYSPLAGLSFVDLVVDGQRLLGFVSSTSSSTASIRSLDLSLSTSLVDHFHLRPHCRLPASVGLSSSLTSLLTSSLTASVCWTYFVADLLVNRRPASAGLTLVDLVVDGQRDFSGLSLSTTSSLSDGQFDFAGLSSRALTKNTVRLRDALSLLSPTA